MQSSRSEILSGAIRNPTIMAMIGSAGIHGILVLTSALKPAESLPTPLRIVSIAPGGTAAGQSAGQPNGGLQMNGLPVPNGLPPINLGDVPELSTLPNLTELGRLSKSTYLGSNPSPIDLGKLSIKNPPQRSVAPNIPSRTYNIPKNFLGAYPPSFNPGNFIGSSPSGTQPLNSPPNSSQYKVNPNPSMTRVSPGMGSLPFNGVPDPSATPSDTPREISPQERGSVKTWAIAKGQQLGQDISIQNGPSLTATYPAEAGAAAQESSARIAVLYGPDGSVVDIQTVQSADNIQMTAAAIEAAKAHAVRPTGAYQIVTLDVRLRPVAALNGPLNGTETPKPNSTQIPSPASSPSVSPNPSPAPSAASSSPPQIEPKPEPKPSPTASNGPLIAPATPLSKDEILRRLTPKDSKAPASSPSDTPSPSNAPSPSNPPSSSNAPSPTESSSSEPLPAPSIAPPQSTPASP
jgi:hypothetical protein